MTRAEAIAALAALSRVPFADAKHAERMHREDIARVLDAYTASLDEEVDYVKEEPDYEYFETS
jgi:vacuolar-type H+-ATPase subunit E/Vma4